MDEGKDTTFIELLVKCLQLTECFMLSHVTHGEGFWFRVGTFDQGSIKFTTALRSDVNGIQIIYTLSNDLLLQAAPDTRLRVTKMTASIKWLFLEGPVYLSEYITKETSFKEDT